MLYSNLAQLRNQNGALINRNIKKQFETDEKTKEYGTHEKSAKLDPCQKV